MRRRLGGDNGGPARPVVWYGLEMEETMGRIALDAEAGQVSAELARRGIAAGTRVHVVVEVVEDGLPMSAIAQAGGAFGWLADEPDLYSDADLDRTRRVPADVPERTMPPAAH
jgi:hypothetical protein